MGLRQWTKDAEAQLRLVALSQEPIDGLTHCFYRYPARFFPGFARVAIEALSRRGATVLDPFMGGGTTVLEAMIAGRRAVGSDINSLSVFVTKAKTTVLGPAAIRQVRTWANDTVPSLRYSDVAPRTRPTLHGVTNLTDPRIRPVGKILALALARVEGMTENAERFARCVLLSVGQWALNGRQRIPSADEIRRAIVETTDEMLAGMQELRRAVGGKATHTPDLHEFDVALLKPSAIRNKADLVVTSPPYPGVHILYHRWQVDGRRESNAPYWLAAQRNGAGGSYYCFADRRRKAEDTYFVTAKKAFSSVRKLMKKHALLVQMVAFSEPDRQLRRYLNMMSTAGFTEMREPRTRRVRRRVPGRRWHANCQGRTHGSREVVLVHRLSD